MDAEKIKEALVSMLEEVADKARQDARSGKSDIGSIYRKKRDPLSSLDPKVAEQAIRNIKVATATKEGTRKLVNAVILAAKVIATKSV